MSELAPSLDFLVDKADWTKHRFEESDAPAVADGQVLFRVDRFALTSNNISYALTGDLLGYWRFFPAPEGWGRIPAMGFGEVVQSRHSAVAEGTRCFGFYPMSRYLTIEPGAVGASQIVDNAAHRRDLAAAYSQYRPADTDPFYKAGDEDLLMLVRGLFTTSFLADDFLADNADFGARQTLISSASSKTSIALGHVVQRAGRTRAVGLTSPRNRAFVESLGCYDEVVLYDEVATLDPDVASVFVDMAGDKSVLAAVHTHFGDQLKFSSAIGATHWDATGGADGLPGPEPQFFFAPTQIEKRSQDWGPAKLQAELTAGWEGFREFTKGWLQIERGYGRVAVETAYAATVAGERDPQTGLILSLWPQSGS